MSQDLKPCPFCGSSDVDMFQVSIMCTPCAAEGPTANTTKEAIAAWNRRTPPAAQEAVHKHLSAGVYACGKMSPPILPNTYDNDMITCPKCLSAIGKDPKPDPLAALKDALKNIAEGTVYVPYGQSLGNAMSKVARDALAAATAKKEPKPEGRP